VGEWVNRGLGIGYILGSGIGWDAELIEEQNAVSH